MIRLNNDWIFTDEWTDAFALSGEGETVRIPHTVKELPLHYIDPASYQMICGYRKNLNITEELLEKRARMEQETLQ